MKVKNGKIVEATRDELFHYYLTREMDDIMSFPEYLHKMKECGVKVKDDYAV